MDPNGDLENTFRRELSILRSEVLLELPTSIGGEVSCITTFQDNLYIGTTEGRVAHYYQFEDVDEYILLSQFEVSTDRNCIQKMLVLPNLARLLVLSGNIATIYSLPELSPLNIGKLKDINDFLLLSYSLRANPTTSLPTDDKVVVFTPTKIRILTIKQDLIRLSKDINYVGSIKGVSTASRMSSNFSNLVLVANHTNYDIIDMQNSRKIPLFEYDQPESTEKVTPYIIPYIPKDNNGDEEYMLTIKSDESTSIAMFINSLGDVTRGTISFMNMGYPANLVVSEWPYVLGIFNNGDIPTLSISSLVTLDNIEKIQLKSFLNIEPLSNDFKETETLNHGDFPTLVHESSISPEDVTNTENADISEEINAGIEAKDYAQNLSVDDNVHESTGASIEASSPHGNEIGTGRHELNEKVEADKEQEEKDEKESEEFDLKNLDEPKVINTSKAMIEETRKTNSMQGVSENYKICNVSGAKYRDNSLHNLFRKVNLVTGHANGTIELHKSATRVLIYSKFKVWITHTEHEIIVLQRKFEEALNNDSFNVLIPELIRSADKFSGQMHNYTYHMTTIALLYAQKFEQVLSYLLRFNNGALLVDPQLLLYLVADKKFENLDIFNGLYKIIRTERFRSEEYQTFLSNYLEKIYPDLINEDKQTLIRAYIYSKFENSSHTIRFIEEKDSNKWKNLSDNADILNILKEKRFYLAELHAYGILLDSKAQDDMLPSLFCTLGISLLSKKLEDEDFLIKNNSKLVDQILYQLKTQTFEKEVYSKYLLEILKVDQEKGFAFMIQNRKHMHSEMHKKIMNDIPQSEANALDFSLLKIEYLETSFMEDKSPEKSKALLKEILQILTSDFILIDENVRNFQIITDTYKVENSLGDSEWPKITWIGYLHVNLKRSEARKLIELYLKAFELFLYLDYKGIMYPINSVDRLPELGYFSIVRENDAIFKLLNMSDFTSAEHFAIHGHLPFPTKTFYFDEGTKFKELLDKETRKENLKVVFNFYIEQVKGDVLKLLAVRHFIQKYGNSEFTPKETINMLPECIPLVYIFEFLNDVVIDLSNSNRMITLQKALNKADSKFTHTIFNDLNEPNAYI